MSVYSFRFNVVENVTDASSRIAAGFANMTRAATTFTGQSRAPFATNTVTAYANSVDTATAALGRFRDARGRLRERNGQFVGESSGGGFGFGGGGGFGLGGIVAGIAASVGVADIAQTAAKAQGLSNALEFTSGGAAKAAPRIAEIRREVDRLGLPLEASMQGFKTLDASLLGSGITAKQSTDIFRGVSTGVSAMSLSADDAQGVFLALGQIASKGKVQAEELRGQIGERVPGAFGIAARAMGVTTAELDKMMEQGKLTASDFLPKFAAEMEKTFQGAVPKAANSLQANMNRISNAFYDFKVGVTPIISGFVSIFAGLAIWAQKNAELIGTFAKVMVYTGGIVAIAAAAQWVYNTSVSVGAFLAGGFTGVVASLNAVFLANPIAWVVGLIAALVVGIIAAWNNFAGFRGFLVGMWAVMKEFGSIIYDYMIAPLMAFGKVLIGAFTLDPAMVTAGISDGIAAVDRITKAGGIGTRLGGAFSKGFADGAASETKIDPIGAMFGKQGGAASVQGGATIIPAGGASGAGGGGIGLNSKLDSVSGGGREGVKNITVSIGKMIETLSFNTTNISESKDKIRAELEKLILDISNDFNYAH